MLADVDCIHSFTVLHQTFSSFLPFQTWPPTFFLQSLTSTVFFLQTQIAEQDYGHNTGVSNLKSFISAKMDTIDPQAHLLCVFLLDGLEVCSQVHGHLVFGAQQRAQDGVSETRTLLRWGRLNLPLRSRLWCSGPWSAFV